MGETFSTHGKAINTEQIAVVEPRGKTVMWSCTGELFLAINFICFVICHDSVITVYHDCRGEIMFFKILSFKRSLPHEVKELKIRIWKYN
jgi:hypothetical protein